MRIAILGGSGLIGRELCRELIRGQHSVRVISRSPGGTAGMDGVEMAGWDDGLARPLEGVEAVINLAGANIGAGRWTEKRKAEILGSRLSVGQAVVSALSSGKVKPAVLIQASAVGYYGALDDPTVDEGAAPGKDSLASIAAKWEDATKEVEAMGVRRCVIRTGVVLSRAGGVLPLMELPVRLFAGGALGSGKQWISWIHIRDEVRAIRFLLENASSTGVYDLCAPNAVRQSDFSRQLARVLHRPYWFPTPGFLLKIVLGEMSTLVLDGQHVLPRRLLEDGFQFEFDELEVAIRDLYAAK